MAGRYNAVDDSNGMMHVIYAQFEPMSCALACMFMIENEVEQVTHADGGGRVKIGWYVAARVAKNKAVVVLDPLLGTLHEPHGHKGIYLNHGLFGKTQFILYTG